MRTIAALLLLTGVAFAEKPIAKVAGPDKGRLGDILIVSCATEDATHLSWDVDSSGVSVPVEDAAAALEETAEALRAAGFKVEAPDTDAPPVYLELDGGKRLLLASYPGTYRLHLAVSNADGVSQAAWQLTVSGKAPDPPKPPDPPGPTPVVEPVLPAGKFGIAIKSWRAAQQVASASRPAEAKQLAAALLVSLTEADGQKMLDRFAATMKTQFTDAQKAAWGPWRTAYLAELTALQQANKLNEKADFATAFTEIALGLSAVEK